MHRLIAVDLPASDLFVDTVERAWASGDAVLPLDQRLSAAPRRALAEEFGAAEIVSSSGVVDLGAERDMHDDEALVIATSGSTGTPKGVVHTHRSLTTAALASASALGLTASNHWLVCLPVSHIGGFSVIMRARHTGASLTLHETFDADAVESAARSGCTHTSLVPTTLRRIDSQLFQRILLGGQAAPSGLPSNVTVTYGSTETGGGITYDGKALPGVELRIVNGEIHVRGKSLFSRYLDGSSARTSDDWFATGDAGTIVNGQLEVTGRMSDMIITGGENVWPIRIEQLARRLPGVDDAVVIALNDSDWGQRVELYLETSRDVTREEVRDVIIAQLPSYYVPRVVHCVASFPRTSIGKVDKTTLTTLDQ